MPKRRRTQIDELDVAEWVHMYEDGLTIRQIAASEGVSYGGVRRHLVEAGVELRARGRVVGSKHPRRANAVE